MQNVQPCTAKQSLFQPKDVRQRNAKLQQQHSQVGVFVREVVDLSCHFEEI